MNNNLKGELAVMDSLGIKPWSVSANNEKTDVENGLLLSANIDKLFDCGLITFNNNGKIFISQFVGTENIHRLHISNTINVDLKSSNRLLSYLEYHRDILYVKWTIFKFVIASIPSTAYLNIY